MTVLVRTSRGIGTIFAINQVFDKVGLETVEIRLNWGSSINDAANALMDAAKRNTQKALLIDIDGGTNDRLFNALLTCIESKSMSGHSLKDMKGIVVVMPESEFDGVKFHPLVARSINVEMKAGCISSIDSLAKAVQFELASHEKTVDLPLSKIENGDINGLPQIKDPVGGNNP